MAPCSLPRCPGSRLPHGEQGMRKSNAETGEEKPDPRMAQQKGARAPRSSHAHTRITSTSTGWSDARHRCQRSSRAWPLLRVRRLLLPLQSPAACSLFTKMSRTKSDRDRDRDHDRDLRLSHGSACGAGEARAVREQQRGRARGRGAQ